MGMSRIRKFDGVMPKQEKRRRLKGVPIKKLTIDIRVETYALLCELAGEHGIGWLLDDFAAKYASKP
jgi:hypothetical protein